MKSDSNLQPWNSRDHASSFDILRWGSVIGGAALALFGLTRRSKPGFALAAAGGLLAYRGATIDSADHEWYVESSFAINCSPEQAFRFWRNFENLPRFMRHLESVKVMDECHSEWCATGLMGKPICWRAEIVDEKENEWIVWRSLEGADIDCRGSVHFRRAVGDRGTIVTAAMQCRPPAGAVGKAVAIFSAKDPEFMVREDLRRFKALMEAGEIPNIEGQTHGPRSALVKGLHAVYPEKRKPAEFETSLQQLQTQRSAS
ncbi:MAG TPA: SRPBCC family protein [Terriglobales bacterium]|nr:SRPBCC family protein [Terriglobales bacterium]